MPMCSSEMAVCDVEVAAWQYAGGPPLPYERRTVLLGGPILMLTTALLSALGNDRRRRAAEAEASPRWRALGAAPSSLRQARY